MKHPKLSLFWTIAGVILLALVLGTLAQAWVAVAVLEPLEARDTRARAELMLTGLASEIAALRNPAGTGGLDASRDSVAEAAIDTLLGRHRATLGARPPWVVYRAREGSVFTAPSDRGRALAPLFEAEAAAAADSTRAAARSDSARSAGTAPHATGALESQPGQPRSSGTPPRFEVIARRPVARAGEALGEILVVRPIRPRGGPWTLASRTLPLFLPIALVTSALVGLLMVRLLVRRLRAIETLAARIAEGDLSVRIADRSGDEIGRLAERLDRMAEGLAEARSQLETTERQRRQLFADITHELATPLTSIRGYAETLLDPRVPMSGDEKNRYVLGVVEESRRLDRLIRDLFELARLEAGASPLEKEPLDWVALCRNTLERFEPRFRGAKLQLTWGRSLDQAWIDADGRRIEEVLENLLTNALRYVPSGGTVGLTLERAADARSRAGVEDPRSNGDAPRFRLTVRDDGPGIPAAELPHVFERFYRGSGARAALGRDVDRGSGLGLAIVREIVERHGGSVRAEINEPRGLAIVVDLPAAS